MLTRRYLFGVVLFVASSLHLWAEPPRMQVPSQSPVTCLAFSPKGDLLAAGCADGTIRVIELSTGNVVRTIATGAPLIGIAFSHDGKTVAISQAGQVMSVMSTWIVASGAKQFSGGLKDYLIEDLAFTPDGQSVVGVAVGKFMQWKLSGGASGSSANVVDGGYSAMSPDGLVCGWSDAKGVLRLREHDPIRLSTKTVQLGAAQSVAFGPNGKLLAVGRHNKTVDLYADLTATQRLITLTGLEQPAAKMLFSADGQTLAMVTQDGTAIRVWDLNRKSMRRHISHNHGAVGAWALSPDGKTLATTGRDGKSILIWNSGTREITYKGPPLDFSQKELAVLWEDLAGADYQKADAAWHKMAAASDNIIPFLREHIRPIAVPKVDMALINKFVADLESPKFSIRETATKELIAAGELAIASLENLLKKPPTAEATARANFVLKKIAEPVLTPERLRVLDAIELLGEIRTAASITLLQEIEQDALIAQIRREAAQALVRIEQAKQKVS